MLYLLTLTFGEHELYPVTLQTCQDFNCDKWFLIYDYEIAPKFVILLLQQPQF